MTYLPVINMLKDYFQIRDRDDAREMREKVTGKLLALDQAWSRPCRRCWRCLTCPWTTLRQVHGGVPWQALDPAERRQRTLDGVKRLLLREARERPLLVVFEDLHWVDAETQALLDAWSTACRPRLLLLVNYRPEYQHAWGDKTYYTQLRIDPLPAESSEELLDALLGDDPALVPLKQLLVEQGNPFFLEESVRTLVETKALAGERGDYRLTHRSRRSRCRPPCRRSWRRASTGSHRKTSGCSRSPP